LIGTGGSGFNYANLTAGANVTITNSSGGITIASSGGGAAGITWATNSTSSGNITVTNPTGYSTSGSVMAIVVVGMSVTSSNASSGSASFSTVSMVASNTKVFYCTTGTSPGSTTTISGVMSYAMAYAYIGGSGAYGVAGSTGFSSSTSTTLSAPTGNSAYPKIIAVSTSSMLNLATAASTASGGGPTWATGSGYQHPNDSTLSAAVWVGTGSWTTSATPTLTANSANSWYITGLTTGA
jgi:hypothetical protein